MATKKAIVPAGPVRWTKTRERTFLEHLALSSNVAASERVALVPAGAAYRHRTRSADFRRNWATALKEGYDRLELAMLERFVLVDSDTLLAWPLPASAIGTTVLVSASGVGDVTPAESSLVFQARALRPPSPVAISAVPQGDGSILVGWTRRSRQGWPWLDDIDAPLGEESELYRLVASRSGGTTLSIDASVPSATIDADQLAAIGGAGSLTLSLVQIGTAAATLPPATFILSSGA